MSILMDGLGDGRYGAAARCDHVPMHRQPPLALCLNVYRTYFYAPIEAVVAAKTGRFILVMTGSKDEGVLMEALDWFLYRSKKAR